MLTITENFPLPDGLHVLIDEVAKKHKVPKGFAIASVFYRAYQPLIEAAKDEGATFNAFFGRPTAEKITARPSIESFLAPLLSAETEKSEEFKKEKLVYLGIKAVLEWAEWDPNNDDKKFINFGTVDLDALKRKLSRDIAQKRVKNAPHRKGSRRTYVIEKALLSGYLFTIKANTLKGISTNPFTGQLTLAKFFMACAVRVIPGAYDAVYDDARKFALGVGPWSTALGWATSPTARRGKVPMLLPKVLESQLQAGTLPARQHNNAAIYIERLRADGDNTKANTLEALLRKLL